MAVTKSSSSTTHFFQRKAGSGDATGRWTPNTDIYVTENGLVIKAELAGGRSARAHQWGSPRLLPLAAM